MSCQTCSDTKVQCMADEQDIVYKLACPACVGYVSQDGNVYWIQNTPEHLSTTIHLVKVNKN